MNIHPITQPNFKGYDARPLKGFLMSSNCRGIAEEMRAIGNIEGFKIYAIIGDSLQQKCTEAIPKYEISSTKLWAQDYWSIVKNKLFSLENDKKEEAIRNFFKLKTDFTQEIDRHTPKLKDLNDSLLENQKKINANLEKKVLMALINKSQSILDEIGKTEREIHIPGGNLFLAKDMFNNNIAIVGENDTKHYHPDEIIDMYDVDNIVILPQMDFHIDLFIRPLNNGKVLLADDNLTLNYLIDGLKKLKNHIISLPINERKKYSKIFAKLYAEAEKFKKNMDANKLAKANEVAEILENNNFEVIRVPARIYEYCEVVNSDDFLKHKCNYLNANVLINDKGELVYITNKSTFDSQLGLTPEISKELNFSFEKNFVDIISNYMDVKHFYFVSGEDNFIANEMLPEFSGGIHCACAEIPKSLK